MTDQLPPENRLAVADMAVPALKRLSPAQYAAFRQVVEALTAADGKIDLFEYCLRVVLFGCLDVQFGLRPAPAVRYHVDHRRGAAGGGRRFPRWPMPGKAIRQIFNGRSMPAPSG